MKKNKLRWFLILSIIFVIISMLSPYLAKAQEKENGTPSVKSDEAFLYNVSTGEVLFDKNSDEKTSIHNLSMLMTTYILIQDIESGKVSTKDKANISNKAWQSQSPTMFLEAGRKVSVQKLLEGLIIASGNDAAVTTAEYISGTTDKFVKRMNKEAKKLGMDNTTFHSPSGGNDDISTAKDMFLLSKAIIKNYPQYLKYYTKEEMKFDTRPGKTVVLKNQNGFVMDNSSAKGLKSGWGNHEYHSVGYFEHNGMKFIVITLNASSSSKRTSDINKILNYGYNQYTVIKVARSGEKYTDFSVYKSTTPGPTSVVYKDDLNVVTRVGVSPDELELDYVGHSYIVGGTNSGDEIGKVKVYYKDKLLNEEAIVSSESFKQVKGFSSFLDSIALLFRQILDGVTNAFH
ncbi:D-alanyl-D-alanine carboxypeptidase family protein [Bacillus mexicanus]|uniref:D-alanyl-D-alanine carboxypeptidase family protein n=1 Tax=Bacillus mexicanus TaxID=2834415 RepID=UPI003D245070